MSIESKGEMIEMWLVELYNTYHGLLQPPGTIILIKHSSEIPRQEMMAWLLIIMRMTNNISDVAKAPRAEDNQTTTDNTPL